jgi:hypothetical protein
VSKKFTLEDVKRDFGFEVDQSHRLAQFGGMKPFLTFLQQAKIRQKLVEHLGERPAAAVLQIAVAIIVGAADMEEVERVSQDPVLKDFLGRPLSATRIPRVLAELTPSQIQKLHELVSSLSLLDLAGTLTKSAWLTIDVDSTSVRKFGKQEGVETGYVNSDMPQPCYQYLLFRLHETHSFMYGTIRGGAAHSQNGFEGYLRQFLPAFAHAPLRVHLRADAGFFSEKALAVCSEFAVNFYCKAPMSESRMNSATHPDLTWISHRDDSSIEYASSPVWRTAEGTLWREVFTRKKKSGVNTLFPEYQYACVATNDLNLLAQDVFTFYNGRANIENNIRELKNDYKLGKIVTQSFPVNDIITQATIMAYVLVQHFKRLVLDKDDRRIELSTLRWRVLNLPTFVVRGARRVWSRVRNAFIDSKYWLRIYKRILTGPSFILRPPGVLIY